MPAPALRGVTPEELAILRLKHVHVHKQLLVEGPDGGWVEATDLGGENWLRTARWGEGIDQPVASATFTLFREIRGNAGTVVSLAPLVSASPLNEDGDGEYAPLIHPNRGIRYRTATVPAGTAPVTADWVTRFDGYIDTVEWGGDALTITARDRGGQLQETMVEQRASYGTTGGTPAETVMQAILADHGSTEVLDVEASPGFQVTAYEIADVSVDQALRTLALQFGGELRFRFTDRDTSALVLEAPRRDLVTPDATLDGDDYTAVPSFQIDPSGVRNVIEVEYLDAETGAVNTVTVENAGSIAVFGRRFMRLAFGESSAINTLEEATTVANAALSDLAEPDATQVVEGRDWWPVTLGALLAWTPNNVHYDEAQLLAVTAFEHQHGPDGETTRITTRGKPAGAYRAWLNASTSIPTTSVPDLTVPNPVIGPLYGEVTALGNTVKDGRVWLYVQFEPNTDEIHVYAKTGPTSPCPAPDCSNVTLAWVIRRQDGVIPSAADWETWVPMATNASWYKTVVAFGVKATPDGLREGQRYTLSAQAVDQITPTLLDVTGLAVTRSADRNVVTFTVPAGMSSSAPIYLMVQRNGLPITRLALAEGANSFTDEGVTLQNPYDYRVYPWSQGVSGLTPDAAPPPPPEVPPVGDPPPPTEPVPPAPADVRPYFLSTPHVISAGWAPRKVRFDYQHDDPTPTLSMRVEGYARGPRLGGGMVAGWNTLTASVRSPALPGVPYAVEIANGYSQYRVVTYTGPAGSPAKEASDTVTI